MKNQVNNVKLIKSLLNFSNKDIFYYLQVISRKKDNPNLKRSEIVILQKFINSERSWDDIIPHAIELADRENARIYISLSPRSSTKLTKYCIREYTEMILNDNYSRPWKVPNSIALSNKVDISRTVFGKTRWILDIDVIDKNHIENIVNKVSEFTKIQSTIPTANGIHLWIDSMNLKKLEELSKLFKFTVIQTAITLVWFKNA